MGLVEINHTSRLSHFDPFVLASQVSQVYYLSYPCKTRIDLLDRWVAYHVAPHGYVIPGGSNDDSNIHNGPTHDVSVYQEDGLEGTFVIELGINLFIKYNFIDLR